MKIGISLLDFQPGKSGGIETYCRDLISGLETTDHKNEYYILLNLHNADTIKVRTKNFHIVYVDSRSLGQKLLGKIGKKVSNENLMLSTVQKLGLDIIHFPLQTIQPYLMGLSAKKIVSIMDVQQEYLPGFFDKNDLEFRRKAYKASCRASEIVISISNFTKQSLVEKLDIPANKIVTVYLNYDDTLFDATPNKPIVKGRYFYYPAATWPHKNHLRLLQAFKKFLRHHSDYKLVLNGAMKQDSAKIERYVKQNDLEAYVVQLGYVEDRQKPALFKNAFALVFPSLFEGFGIPVVEAMASGCPVVCSKTTSLPEVGGKAVLYCDPESIEDIERKMIEVVEDAKLRQELILKGKLQAAKFTKAKMAESTLKVYEKVARM